MFTMLTNSGPGEKNTRSCGRVFSAVTDVASAELKPQPLLPFGHGMTAQPLLAMEPFTHSRCYRAPGRFWGLHHNFSQANHDVPLEPIMLNATRLGFRQLNAALYQARKTGIEALAAIP